MALEKTLQLGLNMRQLVEEMRSCISRKRRIETSSFSTLALSILLFAFFVFFLLDKMTDFPAPVRLLMTIAMIAAAVWRIPKIFRSRYKYPSDSSQIAREIERYSEKLPGRGFGSLYVSAVEFRADRSLSGHKALKDKTIADAEISSARIKDLKMHDRILLKKSLIFGSLALLLYIAWGAISFFTMAVFFGRAIGLPISYPTRTAIFEIAAPKISPSGKDLLLSARARGVIPENGKIEIAFEGEGGFDSKIERESEKSDKFVFKLASPQKSFKFKLYLGDAESDSISVKVIRPPFVKSSSIRVVPPEYAKLSAFEKKLGNFEVLENSKFDIRIIPDRKVKKATLEIRDPGDTAIKSFEMKESEASYRLEGISLKKSKNYSVRLEDADGIENYDRIFYSMDTVPDKLPEVNVLRPRSAYYAPVSRMGWSVKASDDLGMEALLLKYSVSVKDEKGESRMKKEGEFKLADLKGEKELSLSGTFELSSIGLSPGDSLSVVFAIKDNSVFREDNACGKSEPVLLNIVSAEELRSIVQDEILHTGKMVEDLSEDMKHQVKMLEIFRKNLKTGDK